MALVLSRARVAAVALALGAAAGLAAGCRVGSAVGRNVAGLVRAPAPVREPRDVVRRDARLAVTWIGHATVLVQLGDRLVLTDPVFERTVGQLSPRLVDPGVSLERIPPLDLVVVSHLHMDHLSVPSLDALAPRTRVVALPRSGLSYVPNLPTRVGELDLWRTWELEGGLRVTAVPVAHVGHRWLVDDAWVRGGYQGYVFEHDDLVVYFAGDTTYDDRFFAEARARFPRIDVALVPIAPVEPRELMRRTHVGPREALRIARDLGARTMIPIHYDTFVNSTDDPGDALWELRAGMADLGLGDGDVTVLPPGGQAVLVRRDGAPAR